MKVQWCCGDNRSEGQSKRGQGDSCHLSPHLGNLVQIELWFVVPDEKVKILCRKGDLALRPPAMELVAIPEQEEEPKKWQTEDETDDHALTAQLQDRVLVA